MRDVEVWGILHDIAEEDQIEIERARRVGVRPLAAVFLFDGEQMPQQLASGERTFTNNHAV